MDFSVESLETPALTKAQLADMLFEQIGLNKRESKDMIDAFFDLIAASLVDGTDVKLPAPFSNTWPPFGGSPQNGLCMRVKLRVTSALCLVQH